MAKKQIADNRGGAAIIYVGPSVPNVVRSNTVYKNGIPEALKQWIEKYPVFASLLVPLRGVADVRREIRISGSEKNLVCQEAEKIIRGGK